MFFNQEKTLFRTRDDARAAIREAVAWLRQPTISMPDPIGHADLIWFANQAPKADRLHDLIVRQYQGNPYGSPWSLPKPNGGLRRMVYVNPYAEIFIRGILAPHAEELESNQLERTYPGRFSLVRFGKSNALAIKSEAMRTAHKRYRDDLQDLVSSGHEVAISADIANFFGSINPQLASEAFAPVLPFDRRSQLRIALEKCNYETGVPGLPIGGESSAWISNRVLLPSDVLLDRSPSSEHVRWGDDHFFADGTIEVMEADFGQFVSQIARRQLFVAETKTERSWELGLSTAELAERRVPSHGYVGEAIRKHDWELLEEQLLGLLNLPEPDKSLLNSLFGSLAGVPASELQHSRAIMQRLLRAPHVWELSCPQAARYMAKVATAQERCTMLQVAVDFATAGTSTDQVVAYLFKAATENVSVISDRDRARLARQLCSFSGSSRHVPVRGWAREAAFLLDNEYVSEEFVDDANFLDLHPFEQRWAIHFADPRTHWNWLSLQAKHGRWPTTAHWRMKKTR